MATVYDKSSLFLAPSGVNNGTVFVQKPVPIYGSEQVTNGDFDTDSDWNTSATGISISGGKLSRDATANLSIVQNSSAIKPSVNYKITFEIVDYTSGFLRPRFGYNGTGGTDVLGLGTYSQIIRKVDQNVIELYGTNFIGSIDNVSVQEVLSPDGDFTFTRGSNLSATRVNEAQLIEKGRENVLLQSNQFDTTWATLNASVTSGQSGYDGSSDAWLLDVIGGTNSQRVVQAISSSGVKTFSIYMKANTLNWGFIRILDGASNPQVFFDLQNGVLGSNTAISASIESVGNGWYRCSSTTSTTTTEIRVQMATANNSVSQTSGSIYIQDAQLEQGLVATSVITTGAVPAQAGLLENTPRLDYSGGATCPSLLLEPSRTNFVANSEYIAGLLVSYAPIVSLESETNPSGSAFAYKVTANGTASRVQDNIGTQGNNLVFSGFFKGTGVATLLRFANNQGSEVQYNIDTSGNFTLFIETAANDNYGIENYGNGWHRIYFETTTVGSGTNNYVQVYPDSDNGTGSVYIWGLQAEQGSYATSYIPTYGTSQTRAFDVCYKLNASDVIGQTEGTFFWEGSLEENPSGANIQFALSDGTTSQQIKFVVSSSSTYVAAEVKNGGVQQFYSNHGIDAKTNRKYAIAYKANDFAFYIDGTQMATDTSGSVPTCSKLSFDNGAGANRVHGAVKNLTLFKERLSDLQLAILTGATTYETFDEMALALNYTVYE